MLCVNVELQERRYPILIGSGLLQDERNYPRNDRKQPYGRAVLFGYGYASP